MFFFTPEQLRITASNAVGVLYIFALCAMYLANDKRMFIILNTVAKSMLVVMYAVGGLWSSCAVVAGVLIRNMYNTREKTNIFINMLILLLAAAVSLSLNGIDRSAGNLFMMYFPPVSFILGSLTIMFVKSYPLELLQFGIDGALWCIYDLRNAMIMAVTADLICIIMPTIKELLPHLDKYNALRQPLAACVK